MIDTHAHIDADDFDNDRGDVIHRAFEEGLEALLIPAIEPRRFEKLFKTVEMDKRIFCGIGIHPHNAKEIDSVTLNEVHDYAVKNNKVRAIGEIGLDYYYDFAPKDVQKKSFREQLEIAKTLDLPVIVHNRDSDDDLIDIITEAQDGKLRGVLHCFSGDEHFLNKALELNFHVSFTGNVTFKKFDAVQTIQNVPNDRFMVETDSPYMTPVPFRGKRNEPSYVKYVINKIAEIKNLDIEEVIQMTTQNAKKFFSILSLLLFMLPLGLLAQEDDQYYDEESAETGSSYNKVFGIGPVFGTNTIVESFTPNPQDVSYEGLFAYGATIHYGFKDYLIISASYITSKNTKLQETIKGLEPNTHQQIELTANFIVNPHAKINIYAFAGPSYLLNTYGRPNYTNSEGNVITGGIENRNSIGLNTGLGFFFNIPISGAGLITISAEWKLDFMLEKQNFDYDSRITDPAQRQQHVTTSTFFSIPRVNLIFYPQL